MPTIYIAKLSLYVGEEDIRQLFEQYGSVSSIEILKDRFTDKPRGAALVVMDDVSESKAAIEGLDGFEFGGRVLQVSQAQSRGDKGSRGGGQRTKRW